MVHGWGKLRLNVNRQVKRGGGGRRWGGGGAKKSDPRSAKRKKAQDVRPIYVSRGKKGEYPRV